MQSEYDVSIGEIRDSVPTNDRECAVIEGSIGRERNDFLTKILQKLRNTEEREKLLRKQISEVIVENELLRKENCNFRALQHTVETEIDEL